MHKHVLPFVVLALVTASAHGAAPESQPPKLDTRRGDEMLAAYFRQETARLAARSLADIRTLDDWTRRKGEYRRQLFEMLGLDPQPERTPLEARTTGKVERDDFKVEKIVFQSRPQLYVTGTLYLPKDTSKPAPTILYVCGHGTVKKDGVSYGSKAKYQHHGEWFARHGYVCLTIDTLQLGEIEGLHHGTYREGMWWWPARGYTPAGVEAWNSIRALDYLETRPEVDKTRFGVTGRSGGGAYSWWLAALDERVQAAVPVAGITDLQNHVVDGCVEGHCDCMYQVNTYGWDFAQVAALVAPRPLLIANTDSDGIFPLDGVERLHSQVRRIYKLHGADDKLGLQISPGPHKDIQELQIAAFRWFDKHLRKEDRLIDQAAVPLLEPEQLKVFTDLPADQGNTKIHETFVPLATAPDWPDSSSQRDHLLGGLLRNLREKSFQGWPEQPGPLAIVQAYSVEREGVRLAAYDFTSQPTIRLRLFTLSPAGSILEPNVLTVLDDAGWNAWLAAVRTPFADQFTAEPAGKIDPPTWKRLAETVRATDATWCWLAPRGVGPTAWDPSPKKQVQVRRRFLLLGQTLEGMQLWDVRRAVHAAADLVGKKSLPLGLRGHRSAAGLALYAALFEPSAAALELIELPPSHRDGPYFLNVLRFADMPLSLALARDALPVRLLGSKENLQAVLAGQIDYAPSPNKAQAEMRRFQVDELEGDELP